MSQPRHHHLDWDEFEQRAPSRNQLEMSRGDRLRVMIVAFLSWMLAGVVMATLPLAGRAATISFLGDVDEALLGAWMSRYVSTFLLGAVIGGVSLGWLGDRVGRRIALATSVCLYSLASGACIWVDQPWEFLALRFLASVGLGGTWPNAVTLAMEAWPGAPRPFLAGMIGTSAGLGSSSLALLVAFVPVVPDRWRWVMVVAASPVVLGVAIPVLIRESPAWLQARRGVRPPAILDVFRPPNLRATLLGIALATPPLVGIWASANWLVLWADQLGGSENPYLKGWTQLARAGGAIFGALAGGYLASRYGRRLTYFVNSVSAWMISMYVFCLLTPEDPSFFYWVAALGFFGSVYFGWLPYYLPELFPTNIRATGTGATYNCGRVVTVIGVLFSGSLLYLFDGEYQKVGQVTCCCYVIAAGVIWLAPEQPGHAVDEGSSTGGSS